jgi:hypothetical protein
MHTAQSVGGLIASQPDCTSRRAPPDGEDRDRGLHVLPALGVPKALSALHHACGWNETGALQELFSMYSGQIAALVIAADYARMDEGRTFYPFVRELAGEHGTLLIFDEIVTGFRVALGGVQEHFGVSPDLAVFAKGIATRLPQKPPPCCPTGSTAPRTATGYRFTRRATCA